MKISASRLKTLEECSWRYYSNYILKIPQDDAFALLRGSLVHLVLEVLTVPRHQKYYYEAISKKSVLNIAPLYRLIFKYAYSGGFSDGENLAEIDAMIMTALEYDFLCKGAVGCDSEKEFNIDLGNGVKINGFMDRVIYYDDGSIKVRDYKTSKNKFSDKEIYKNYQGLIYSLACFMEMGEIPEVEFLFLKFRNKPGQITPLCSERKLDGFRHHLLELAPRLKNFNKKSAVEDLAANNYEKKWLCGKSKGDLNKAGLPAYICPYKYPYKYYEVVGEDGKVIESATSMIALKKLSAKNRVVEKKYPGCPAWGY